MIISFAGHALVSGGAEVKKIVKEQVQKVLSNVERTICYLGGYGEFDEICARACRELKREHSCIELVYVAPYMTLSEQAKIREMQALGLYDSSIYPPIERVIPKFAIAKRNEWMMTNADVIIAYVNHCSGGAYRSLQIAKRRKKKIINICDFLTHKGNC